MQDSELTNQHTPDPERALRSSIIARLVTDSSGKCLAKREAASVCARFGKKALCLMKATKA